MLSAPPTPIRPPCRTRRRSSSFSTFSSSPAAGDDHHWATSPKKGSNRHEGKRARRIDFRGGDSPLKQSQPLFAPIEPSESSSSLSWTQPSPFSTPSSAFALTSGPLSVAPHAGGSLASLPPPPSTSFFSANARDFSLPSFTTPSTSFTFDAATPSNPFTTRTRHSSSAGDSSFSSSSLSSSPPSSSRSHIPNGLVFEDSSFSSTSTTSSRSSPTSTTSNSLNSGYHYASSSSTSTSPASTTAAFTFSCAPPLPLPPALRRVSSCHSALPSSSDAAMLCDDPAEEEEQEQQVVAEAERLHHVAFEQLRHETSREGEGFVERMRRWEAEQQQAVPSLPPTSAPLVEEEDEDLDLCAEEEEDEVELTLDLGHHEGSSPPAVSSTELDDLTRRLRAGACELEDFALVREVQARERGGSRSAVRA